MPKRSQSRARSEPRERSKRAIQTSRREAVYVARLLRSQGSLRGSVNAWALPPF